MSWSSWIKSGVAAVAGTAEPEYGSGAVQSICDKFTPEQAFSAFTTEDYRWIAPDWGSNVETQTFYVTTDEYICFAQIIHSNPTGLSYTAQFTCRVFSTKDASQNAWSSTTLENFSIENDGRDFRAKGVSVRLSEDNTTYTLKMNCAAETIVDLKVKRETSGFKIGRDGTTTYGTDPAKPWGSMRHLFWPRCTATGTILVRGAPIDVVDAPAEFIHALQGMKPHHAARRWNFANFQGKAYSATMMEFTTPSSYADTVINIGGIATAEGKILAATCQNTATHLASQKDDATDWPEPTQIEFVWKGVTSNDLAEDDVRKGGKTVEAKLTTAADLHKRRLERVDVLAEIPPWLKKIAHGVSGTKPFIYQYAERDAELVLTVDGKTVTDKGTLFIEATFIS
ncbi:Putative cell survival pathways protein [Savitreella phatthalungensis]